MLLHTGDVKMLLLTHTNLCWWVQNTALNNRTLFQINTTLVSLIKTETKPIYRHVSPFANQQISKHFWPQDLEKTWKSKDDSPVSIKSFFKQKSVAQMSPESHHNRAQPRVTHILHLGSACQPLHTGTCTSEFTAHRLIWKATKRKLGAKNISTTIPTCKRVT